MIALPHKTKQYGWFALKVFILVATGSFVYHKLTSHASMPVSRFWELLVVKQKAPWLLFIALAALNWIGEIAKWQSVAAAVRPLPFAEAAKQSLAALALSLATPNRIGEYGAKAYFYNAKQRKKIVVLTFFANAVQLLVTLLFGSAGLCWALYRYPIALSTKPIAFIAIAVGICAIMAFIFRNRIGQLGGPWFAKLLAALTQLTRTTGLKVLALSVFRYLCFSYLFWLLLRYFGAEIPLALAWPLICTMYLLASLVPTLLLLDVVVRGGVALWLFSMAGVPQLPVLATTVAMWLLNMVLPALWGSLYVVTYSPQRL